MSRLFALPGGAALAAVVALGAALCGVRAGAQAVAPQAQAVVVRGMVRDSLFHALEESGEDPELALRLGEIFGSDLDFYADTKRGDVFRILVEKRIAANGEDLGYGRILAAEYDTAGRALQAVLFHDSSGAAAYYSADGRQLQKEFLRSPLKPAALLPPSAGRAQPVVIRFLPNFGMDYKAAVGTPVQAIGDGRVIFAGPRGQDGNMIEIEHADSVETLYLHLSAVLVRAGQHVAAGGRIGVVGASPMVFRVLHHGANEDFEALWRDMPEGQPLAGGEAVEFAAVRERALTRLYDVSLESRSEEPADGPPDSR